MNTKEAKKFHEIIKKTATHFVRCNPYLLKNYEVEDLTQEVFTHFLDKKFFEKFDPAITSLQYFVAKATKNHLIDIYRKGVDPASSLDVVVGGQDGSETRLEEMVAGNLTDQFSGLLLKELLVNCPNTQISPNYSLSWRELLQYLMEGYRTQDLHKVLGISSGRISQLKTELFEMLNYQHEYLEA